ncbi:pseudouridylate synthase TRUB2, mitochondrial isoform X1 [Rhineura floridana]|uniref:pseudouridylate synthase TRUB2, mitochondrial isoform X1 n=1 Tax=Rhineura floridana TaxID=261503 RepID=UPI002AC868DA|nr:pseudouridylate synthase TRUB2, mitochondrial isoform X1 [Rhineura floridana]
MRAAKADLQGLFAVYKPPSVSWKLVRDAVETHLLKDLNSLERPAPRQLVRFLPGMVEGEDGKQLTMTVTQVPTLADHPLVSGPAVTHLKVGAGHRLDTRSSGVLVLGVGHGNKLLTDLYNAHLTRTYTVRGLFGKATDDFSDTGKLIEKATFDHITREQLERIVSVIQGSNHKALLQYANIDLKTQEAYELAVRGLIRPMEKTPPLITAVRCIQFAPPEFQLEIHCLHETQQYLRKIVHEIGLEMKSVAVCTQVRRIRDGVFTVDDVLLRTQWNLQNIRNAILKSRHKVETEIQNNLVHEEASTDYEREKETRAGSVVDSTQVREREDALPASSVVKW